MIRHFELKKTDSNLKSKSQFHPVSTGNPENGSDHGILITEVEGVRD